ncbi:alpha-xylosidase [Candidatus Sumerlaeota bacterium]|nr:alpha-xylosidase [Candidatus Sumerlaeota bacterium]
MQDILDLEQPEAEEDRVWRACRPTAAREADGDVFLTVPFEAQKKRDPRKRGFKLEPDPETARRDFDLRLRAYGDAIVRVSLAFAGQARGDDGPMLDLHDSLRREALSVRETETGWEVVDSAERVRARVRTAEPPTQFWRAERGIGDLAETLDLEVLPDGATSIPFSAYDQFTPNKHESLALAFVERADAPHRACFSLRAAPDEAFAGTGERFAKMDLAGRTLRLENIDALGVNNRRAYKNVPFYVSSRPYGLFAHTSHHVRLSLADVSTRAAQGLVEEPRLDLFLIGGGSVERVLYDYRRLTGFPPEMPLWSYGTWMSRMTYFSADEVREIARRLREGEFPCDVLHIDTGWFAQNWVCDWEFDKERFAEPEKFLREMLDQGFRVSLWQTPNVSSESKLRQTATEKRYIAPLKTGAMATASDFSAQEYAGQIDFSNPEADRWYREELLAPLLEMGVACIKTDFGEFVNLQGDFLGMPAEELHNLFALLYQRAAFEVTKRITGDGIVWARAGWAGCQRYPVHWGGDAAGSWDGLAGSLRGGLHLGLSGFGYWSHDVPGFHGVPDFMNSKPPDDLYVRWTQFGVLSSHLRYHGTYPREPYEYPEVADIVRKWLRLRYALIPYLLDQAKKTTQTGLPILRALVFHHEDDPACWRIDDQYYFGDDFLVAPVMNASGVRDVYLPRGQWVDFWTGEKLDGARRLEKVSSPLDRIPVYVKAGAEVRVYPDPVQCTDEMDLTKSVVLAFDGSYRGIAESILGPVVGV